MTLPVKTAVRVMVILAVKAKISNGMVDGPEETIQEVMTARVGARAAGETRAAGTVAAMLETPLQHEKGKPAVAISGFGVNVLHVTPSHHFPLGIVMPVSRRQELLRWANSRADR